MVTLQSFVGFVGRREERARGESGKEREREREGERKRKESKMEKAGIEEDK